MCKNLIANQLKRQACQQFIDTVSNPYAATVAEIYDSCVKRGDKEV